MINAVITGAGQGIGFETACLLTERNVRVIAVSRNAAKLDRLKEACDPALLQTIPFDLVQDDLSKLVARIREKTPSVNLLINNAGMLIHKPFTEVSEEDLAHLFRVNLFAPYRLIQHLLPFMKQETHILNIGSMGGFQGSVKFPGLSVYSASKAALANLTESLAAELSKQQIKVNCLALGAVQTEMLSEAFPGYNAPVSAREMAGFIAGFALEGHKFFNGKVIPVSMSTP
jgi:short-subunit dehydrogenase